MSTKEEDLTPAELIGLSPSEARLVLEAKRVQLEAQRIQLKAEDIDLRRGILGLQPREQAPSTYRHSHMDLDPVVDVFGTRLSEFNGYEERLLRDDGERFWAFGSQASGEIRGMKLHPGDERFLNERSYWLPLGLRLDAARIEVAAKREAFEPLTAEEKTLEASVRSTLTDALERWVEVFGLKASDDFRSRAPSWIGVNATCLARAQRSAKVPDSIVTLLARSLAREFVVEGMFGSMFGKTTPWLNCLRAMTPFQHELRKEREKDFPGDGAGGNAIQQRLTEAMSLPRTGRLIEADRDAVNGLMVRLGLYVKSWHSQMPLTPEGEDLMGAKIRELAGEIVVANHLADVPASLVANEGRRLLCDWFTEPQQFKALTGLSPSEVHKVREAERKVKASELHETVKADGSRYVFPVYADIVEAGLAGGLHHGDKVVLRKTIEPEPEVKKPALEPKQTPERAAPLPRASNRRPW